jgi:GNAT superfamily N-acetyltransferase
VPDDRFRFEPLGAHKRGAFSCGIEALDRYFREQAGQDLRRRLAVSYVLVEVATGVIAGYYTLSGFTIAPASLPETEARRTGRYAAIPAVLLGRLAVDRRYQGQRLGEMLLMDALRRALELSTQLGAWAVVVDAKGDAARRFYERYEFMRVLDDKYRLFLPMQTIKDLGL